MSEESDKIIAPIIRDTLDLRRYLLQSLDRHERKQLTTAEITARCRAAFVILGTVNLELKAARAGTYRPVVLDPTQCIEHQPLAEES